MRPKAVRLVVIALGLALTAVAVCVFVACGNDNGASANESVTGVIISLDAPSLTELNSFTLRSNDGRELVFHIAPDAQPAPSEGFVPGHLRTHAVEAAPIEVFYREENGELLALRLVHAQLAPP